MRATRLARTAFAAALLAAITAPTISSAALVVLPDPRFVYDDVLDVTWLRDANYAGTQWTQSGGTQGAAGGRMTWSQANAWAAGLSFTLSGMTFDQWRLPTLTPVNSASFNYGYAFDGSTDNAYNVSAPGSAYPGSTAAELAYMFYVNLGNVSGCSVTGQCPVPGSLGTATGSFIDSATLQQASFENFPSGTAPFWWYWYDKTYSTGNGWILNMYDGKQGGGAASALVHAWAVHPGMVMAPTAVSEPATLALLGLGLAGLAAARRRKQ